jgi:hypothetical protein
LKKKKKNVSAAAAATAAKCGNNLTEVCQLFSCILDIYCTAIMIVISE